MKKVLICGVTGQDGAYLARLLILKGYEVWGTSRDVQMATMKNLNALGIASNIKLMSMTLSNYEDVLKSILLSEPDEIYNLSGQTSVALSFKQPIETFESISIANLNLLEAIKVTGRSIRFYNAGSSEIFGNCIKGPANESTAFHPKSPYAIAKCSAFWQTENYRDAYKIFACTGILFNHESPLRAERFVTQKVVQTACRIASGSDEKLSLGDIGIIRDWGWAPEYVEAIWRMLQLDNPDDYVLSTGKKSSLEDFVKTTFECCGLDWRKHVILDEGLLRPNELRVSYGDSSKAEKELGWSAKYGIAEIINEMVSAAKLEYKN
ncbi:GDP-mannose 4,6-dehydratase [Limnohabitans sp. Jir72]|uniref:GDP-mannose 4,6-dehydratase n=1 Tax=Limnohabitans sp. Jir72 TaxID=1977909 RepID=UPI000D37DD55|nr:GDP-mannose 4,6-dehydratase [Limnohabitans sp. Jir72]PUE24591.1 GDP-mannose 4,6-dehydratase [Limnohabitans sp. Jir72]